MPTCGREICQLAYPRCDVDRASEWMKTKWTQFAPRMLSATILRSAVHEAVRSAVAWFSKKLKNLATATALHMAYYNFVWRPSTLKGCTPAMAAGVTNRLWK